MSQGNVNPPPGPQNEEPISLVSEDPIEEPISVVPQPRPEQPISVAGPAQVDEQPVSLAGPGEDDEPISLVDSDETAGPSKVKFGGRATMKKKAEFTRPLNVNGTGATRCRLFRTKMGLAAIDALDQQISEWLDSEEIEVKHVCQNIGDIQGKTIESNLIITVWY